MCHADAHQAPLHSIAPTNGSPGTPGIANAGSISTAPIAPLASCDCLSRCTAAEPLTNAVRPMEPPLPLLEASTKLPGLGLGRGSRGSVGRSQLLREADVVATHKRLLLLSKACRC